MLCDFLDCIDFSLMNQIFMFFIVVMLVVIMVLVIFILKMLIPIQQIAEKMAKTKINISGATPAAVAANAYRRSPGVVDTFNPYRYFVDGPEAPSSDYLRSRDTRVTGRNLNMSSSTQNISPLLRSPQRRQMSRDDQTTPLTTIYHQSPVRMSPAERDGVALFSPKDESSQPFSPRNTFISYENDDSHFFPQRRNVPRSNQYDY